MQSNAFKINHSVHQLGGALIHLDPVWKGTFNQRTRVLNPNFVSTSVYSLMLDLATLMPQ